MAVEIIKTEEGSEGSLAGFNWDSGEDSFFGITPSGEKSEVEKLVKEVKADGFDNEDDDDEPPVKIDAKEEEKPASRKKDKANPKSKSKDDASTKKDEDENEEIFFDQKGEESEKGASQKEEHQVDDKGTKENFWADLASDLKERGTFQNVEIKEDEEIDEEKFFELQDAEVEARVDETFEAFFGEMDDDGKAFLKFKKNGGKTSDFIAAYSAIPELEIEKFDAKNKDQNKKIIAHYLRTIEGSDEDEIKDRLDFIEEQGKAAAYAEKYFNKLEDLSSKRKADILEAQEIAATKKEEGAKKFIKELSEVLAKTESVGNFKFTAADQKKLTPYITKATVKVGKNKYVPEFQSKLGEIMRAETPEAKQKLLLIAKLVESNFDTSDLLTKVKTEITREVKSKLRDSKNGVRPSSSGSYTKKSLQDYDFN